MGGCDPARNCDYMDQPTRKRIFASDSADPRSLAGKALCMPDLKRYLAMVHSGGGWGSNSKDEQSSDDFRFSGSSLGRYSEKVLGMKLEKIYMPLAYAGVIAKELSDAGHSIFATDLSGHWVARLKGMGLRAEVRSFEDIPEENFDAVVCFEPDPVSPYLVGYIGMLRILTAGMAYLEINSCPHFGHPPEGSRTIESMDPAVSMIHLVGRKPASHYPLVGREMARQAYDYGNIYTRHRAYHDEKNFFDFDSITATPRSLRRMGLDLMLLEKQDEWASSGIASIGSLSKRFHVPPPALAASLERLRQVARRYDLVSPGFDTRYLFPYSIRQGMIHDPRIIRSIVLEE